MAANGALPANIYCARDYEDLARRALDAPTFAHVSGGAGRDTTVAANLAAFEAVKVTPRVLRDLTRGSTAWLYRHDLPRRELPPLALSAAVSSLGIVVVIANVGLRSKQLGADTAQALIGAALLSLLVYPTVARVLLARQNGAPDGAPSLKA